MQSTRRRLGMIADWKTRKPPHNVIGLDLVFDFSQANKVLRLQGCSTCESESFLHISLARTGSRGDLGPNEIFLARSWEFLRFFLMLKCVARPSWPHDGAMWA